MTPGHKFFGVDMEKPGERLGFGVEPMHAALGLLERWAGDIQRLAGGRMGGLGAHCRAFGLRHRGLRLIDRGGEGAEIGPALRIEGRELGLDRGHLGLQPGAALGLLAHRVGELIALGGEVGEGPGQLRESLLCAGQDFVVGGDPLIGAGAQLRVGLRLAPQRFLLGRQPPQRRLRVIGEPALALDIRVELDQALVELGDAFLGAGFLAFEGLAGDDETLQGGGGADLGVAQRRELGGGLELAPGGLGLLAGARCDHPHRQILGVLGFCVLAIGGDPAQVEQGRLGLANLLGDDTVADRLLGLALEGLDLAGELVDDVLEPRQVGLGPPQPQLRLVPARMQAGDAGGLLQHARRCSGLAAMISPMRPWWTSAGEREPVEASASRIYTSRARASRPLIR